MIDIDRIRSLLAETRKRVRQLEINFKPLPEEKLVTDEVLYAAAERNLQVAIQTILDISNHLVSTINLAKPIRENKEAIIAIGQEGIIPIDFAMKLTKMIGYRNVLVHQYTDVERNNTYVNIQENLGDFALFARYIEQFITEQQKDIKELDKTKNLNRIPFKKSKEKR